MRGGGHIKALDVGIGGHNARKLGFGLTEVGWPTVLFVGSPRSRISQ